MSAKKWFFTLMLLVTLVVASCKPATTPPPAVQPTKAPEATKAPEPTKAPEATKAPEPTKTPEPTKPPEPTATPVPAQAKVATLIWTQEFDTLNPLYTNMWFSATTFQIWNCYAWDFDDQNKPVPVLIKEIPSMQNGGVSADGKVITLKLRDDIVWSDGTPITAEDFIFTYKMTIEPKNTVATTHPYDKIAKIEAPDPKTLVTTFTDPFAPWLGTLWKGIIPAHILQPVFDKDGTLDNAEWNRKPTVGCGPFVFKEWESGSFARFVANTNYWRGRPKLDEIFFRFVPDDASQIAAMKSGEGDLGTFFAISDVPDLEKAGVTMIKAYSGYNEGIYFNMHPTKGHPALKDQNVRLAIAYATDRPAIVKDLLLGLTGVAATYWDNTPYVDPSIKPYPYDPEKAKELLDQAGWIDENGDGVRSKDGVDLVLKYGTTTREIRKDTQAVIQQQLAAVGIKVELLNYDSDTYFNSYGAGGPAATFQLDMFEYSTSPNFPDPDTGEWLCNNIPSDEQPSGNNWSGLCDTTLDKLFQDEMVQVDFNTRQQTFYKITKYIFDQVYFLGLWHDPDLWGVNNRLLNVKFSGATPLYNVWEWDLTQ